MLFNNLFSSKPTFQFSLKSYNHSKLQHSEKERNKYSFFNIDLDLCTKLIKCICVWKKILMHKKRKCKCLKVIFRFQQIIKYHSNNARKCTEDEQVGASQLNLI